MTFVDILSPPKSLSPADVYNRITFVHTVLNRYFSLELDTSTCDRGFHLACTFGLLGVTPLKTSPTAGNERTVPTIPMKYPGLPCKKRNTRISACLSSLEAAQQSSPSEEPTASQESNQRQNSSGPQQSSEEAFTSLCRL